MEPTVFIFLQFMRKVLLPLPGVTEKMLFDTPAFYINKKTFARIKEDGETLVVHTIERDKWIQVNPDVYFITDHYLNYDYMLVCIDKADPAEVEQLLVQAWRNRATKKLITAYETGIV
jgi:hypothetical protein